jgi:F-type H+-transporting ATPase subunit b
MNELISQLGIDWRSLLSQAVNFLLLLLVLRFFVYRPVLKILKARKARIEEGLVKAKEANERLNQIEEIGKDRLKEAEEEALGILRATEGRAKKMEAELLLEAKRKEAEELRRTEAFLKNKEDESRAAMKKEATKLVKDAIVRTVGLSPDKIDEALVRKAVEEAAAGPS